MAGSLNKVLLIGRLGADPEIKQMVNGKSVARLSLATSQSWKDKNKILHEGSVLEVQNNFDVIQCKECGFAHIVPIPTEEELQTIYVHEYYDEEKPLYIDRYIEDQEWHDAENLRRYDIFEQHVTTKHRKILDIGSGPGLFLKLGKERGWDVQGIEPSQKAYEYSSKQLGLNVFNGFFNKDTYKKFGTFDVVNLSLVLEHIPNPEELIKLIKLIMIIMILNGLLMN